MEESPYRHELRQVKRRRIEIRGAKAALDMEEFNLDDRQSVLERLLQNETNWIPSSTIDYQEARFNDGSLQTDRHELPSAIPVRADFHMRESVDEAVNIKNKTKRESMSVKEDPATIAIDDDNEDVVMFDSRGKPLSASSQSILSRSSIQRTSRRPLSPKDKTVNSTAPLKPTKVVVLKVNFNPHQPHNIRTSTQSKSTSAIIKSQSPSSPLLPSRNRPSRPQSRATNPQPLASPSQPHQSGPKLFNTPPAPPQLKSSSTSNLRPTNNSITSQSQIQPCLCLGRDRNCRQCRGTPAVIAEGLSLKSLITPPQSSPTNSFGKACIVGQRPVSRPQSYRIEDFEEMTDDDRRELELRFCRRVVIVLFQTMRGEDSQEGEVVSEKDGEWIRKLRRMTDVSKTLLEELRNLLRRKAVAREDGDGVWDGKVWVSSCRDRNDFVEKVRAVLDGCLRVCPLGCCSEVMAGAVGTPVWNRNQNQNVAKCWKVGFTEWFEVQMKRCRDCVEACASALNVGERRVIVDEWVIG